MRHSRFLRCYSVRTFTHNLQTLAMPLYALATIPLINALTLLSNTKQVWYAHDSAKTWPITGDRQWLDSLVHIGPSYEYYINVKRGIRDPHRNSI